MLTTPAVVPTMAGASVDPDGALHAYARARMADGDGALGLAVASYREALKQDPARIEIARRSYVQALESGDRLLARQSAALLDAAGLLPRDGTLLLIGEALSAKNWVGARTLTDRMLEEGNFAFLTPIIRSWISLGEGRYAPPVIDGKDRFAALGLRYADEHTALQALARSDLTTAAPATRRALAVRSGDGAALRLAFAGQFAARGAKAEALTLLPVGSASFAQARADIAKGKGLKAAGAATTPAQGFARLLARLAADVSSDSGSSALGLRLARIATFADPTGPEIHIVAARLLTAQGHAAGGVAEAEKVPANGWYGALAQAELIDALAAAGDMDRALALARAQAAEPGAEAERQVRLGRLLAQRDDFDGAAAAFRAAQAGYADDQLPWTLLLFEGSALEQGKRWDEARAVLERAAKIAPNEPVILNYLGYAQIERRQNVEAALELLKKASALKPQDASITDSLGWAQFVTGDVDAAVPVLERAAAAAPTDSTINEHLGDALWVAGRRYEARYAWAAASVFAEGDVAARLAAKRKMGMMPEYAAP
ncbi:tetratricopeptide repeat protein [Sphingobium cupriresistens]|uniref:Tetratricopeptide repeat protein n=1 Tax=Sphingobium cupriresistens TaxID=1132417 RepID=A0A8G2DZV6_9SPHN|nr:tetratricopeptide repeat protein [Sphingobium cupriresistens]RYM11325.1 tetratricopeptide repeat protein [Sphingobium cupriresistens]